MGSFARSNELPAIIPPLHFIPFTVMGVASIEILYSSLTVRVR